jgi:2'-5' RNA ligase
MLRLFFALQPAPEQNAALTELIAPLVVRLKGQEVPAENLHATLCFVGAVAEEKLPLLKSIAAGIRSRSATLRFDALEYWPKPRVICATAREDSASEPARNLAERLAAATVESGFTPDIKPFRAHLTLARKIHGGRAKECKWPRALASPVQVHCDRFVLMRSDRGEAGSVYSVVHSWPLDA